MATLLLSPPNQIPLISKAPELALLERCSDMEELKQIHGQMIKTGLVLDTIPASRLLAFCAKPDSSSLAYARLVFDRIQRPNTFMWNTIIRGYSNGKDPEEALLLYHQMIQNSAAPNSYTFPFLLKACTNLSALEETRQIHCHIVKKGFGSEVYATNSLLHVYARSGNLAPARLLFDRIQHRDTVSWNSMIDGYARSGEIVTARELFHQIPSKNIISWTSMITGYIECGLFKEALTLFHEMQVVGGIKPDGVALVSALSACAHLGALEQGRWVCSYIDKHQIQIDPILGCILVDMYAKCGDIEEAVGVFRRMGERSVTAWTAMINGFAIHGRGKEALDLFSDMVEEGIKPNHITLTGVLTACSHAGLVEEGRSFFKNMEKTYGMRPSIEHYGCMVDLLGRAGLLKEAKELIMTMPVKPNAAVWGALLNACCIYGDIELGKRIGQILINLDSDHGGRYVHLASIFASAGQWDEAVRVRKLMRSRGVSKLPGCSSIDLKGVVHEFFAGDRSHPMTEEIYVTWDRIVERLRKEEGYFPCTENLLLDLEEEEKETAIHRHSEKLAIAFGFISTEPGTTIRIVKNLRVCKDCHSATKLISKVYAREIVVRDRTRFHLFKDGHCSCQDYW